MIFSSFFGGKILEKDKVTYFNFSSNEIERNSKETAINARKEIKALERSKPKRRKSKFSLRVRRFVIKNPLTRHLMEFGYHLGGVHWVNNAVLHSENGCLNCKWDSEI